MEHFINAFYAYTSFMPTDIYPVQYGEEKCKANHAFGPCIRSNYLLHYIYSGEGIFRTENEEYSLKQGQMFLIKPNELAYYKADSKNAWHYCWIEFNGSMAKDIISRCGMENIPIYTDSEEMPVGEALRDIVKNGDMPFEKLMQKLWGFISLISTNEEEKSLTLPQKYIKKAENFIKINIHKKITVNNIAEYIGINRSYLSRLFQENNGKSPQRYILELKMNTAANYLKNTNISIKEAAQSVGYYDSHVFNKAFKSVFNSSPQHWRNKQDWSRYIIN